MPLLPAVLVSVARQEIGVTEIAGSNCGPRVNEFKSATNLPPTKSWPWCAAFVCWCVREAMRITGTQETKTFKRPKTAGAWDFKNWSLAQDNSTNTKSPHRGDILPGDIVIFKFSHIGIATSSPNARGFVQTIEGNTDGAGSREGGAVLPKTRHVSKIKTRIRFTV